MFLLSIEWLKIKKYRTFWILAGLFIVLLTMWNYLISNGMFVFTGNKINFLSSSYSFPGVWDNIGFWTKTFSGLIAIIVVILVTNEYQYRTNRQNIIDGLTRLQFYHSKWLLVLCLSLAVTLFSFLLGIVFAVSNSSDITNFSENLKKIGYVFILTLNYFSFAMTLSFFLKRSGMTIVIFLLYIYIIELIAQKWLNWHYPSKPGDFLPLQCSAELLDFPLMDMAKGFINLKSGPSENVLMLTSGFWIVVYYFIGRIKMLRSDW